MIVYTYKQLYKPGKVITVHKKEERNINFVTKFLLMLFKSNKFFDLKIKKSISETSYPKIDIIENV